VERAIILSKGSVLKPVDFVSEPRAAEFITHDASSLESAKRALYVQVLEECHWRIKGKGNAAERLGLKPSTLRYQLNKMGIVRKHR
jgi:transcriptional regulator with GAF, ATPase, and Fis domain